MMDKTFIEIVSVFGIIHICIGYRFSRTLSLRKNGKGPVLKWLDVVHMTLSYMICHLCTWASHPFVVEFFRVQPSEHGEVYVLLAVLFGLGLPSIVRRLERILEGDRYE